MDWVNSPHKGQNASALLQEFESRFAWLSRLDRTVLETSKVLFFVTSFDSRVRESVDLLLETNRGLTTDWAIVKEVCSRIDKHCVKNRVEILCSGRQRMCVCVYV